MFELPLLEEVLFPPIISDLSSPRSLWLAWSSPPRSLSNADDEEAVDLDTIGNPSYCCCLEVITVRLPEC